MSALRFGRKDHVLVLLDGLAWVLGASHWEQVLSPQDKHYARTFVMGGEAGTADFLQARGM